MDGSWSVLRVRKCLLRNDCGGHKEDRHQGGGCGHDSPQIAAHGEPPHVCFGDEGQGHAAGWSVMDVISGGQSKRNGKPMVPMPRLTCSCRRPSWNHPLTYFLASAGRIRAPSRGRRICPPWL